MFAEATFLNADSATLSEIRQFSCLLIVSIKVFNEEGKKSIRITENITFVISPTPLVSILKDSDLRIYLDFIHDENKKTLKDILAPEISNIIKL